MKIADIYSFNGGLEAIRAQFGAEYEEIEHTVAGIESVIFRTKTSKEKTMPGGTLYNPRALNVAFDLAFTAQGWQKVRVKSVYSTEHYVPGFAPRGTAIGAFREIDFVKNRLGVEIQFGKYAFMVYNVCAKMTIFHNLDIIDVGIEIVPVKDFADEMSTGVSYFEQIVWDLEHRGASDIDIPVLILGITD